MKTDSFSNSIDVKKRLSDDVVIQIKKEIKKAKGNEVFFEGQLDGDLMISSIFAAARGNSNTVPVNISEYSNADVLIHNHPSGNLTPSDADLIVASNCSEEGKGFFIINNSVSEIYVVMEPSKKSVIEQLDSDEVKSYLAKDGPLSKIYNQYEERPSQISLLKNITDVFNTDSVGIFEAGTGVGKSFAYLIPSILWSVKNKERVVISTGTINLQQQLSEKDIPLAQKITGTNIKAILVKGRQNYLCLRRLNEISKEPDLFSDDQAVFDKIFEWSKKTKNGSKSDLSFQPPENIWQRISSEADACMGMRCKYYSKCFVMKMKKEASDANILIVNHHILFADIQSRMDGAGFDGPAVLPMYKRIIFDEAHGIEDAATSFFSNYISRFKIIKQLNLLFKRRRGSASGFLFTISALSECDDKSAEIEIDIDNTKNIILELEDEANKFLGKENSVRIYSANSNSFEPVLKKIEKIQIAITKIISSLREIIDGIPEDYLDDPSVWETKSVLRRLDSVVAVCKNYEEWTKHNELVFWIQRSKLPPSMVADGEMPFYYVFMQTPLNIAPLMNEGIFESMSSVSCVSATLGIEGKFDFWEERTGVKLVNQDKVLHGIFESPFPYDKNMVFAVPSDAPFPDNLEYQKFVDYSVTELIKSAGGKTLVLFTSYDMLRKNYEVVREKLKDLGITLLKQGDDDRFRLLSKFKEDTSSVLFATDSFWEGVDVPGDSLSQVIIVKLPFGVPSDPVFSARSELVQNSGGNPFMELSVPEAVIKFRQGFGRLIRRGDDKGAVIVLDRRIVEKRYGSIFLSSIPNTKRVYSPLTNMIKEIKPYL